MPDLQSTFASSKPKIAIIEFPGSNCETESIYAVTQAGMEAHEFLWNRPVTDLEGFDGYFIIGGFSYEDRSRSGIISAKNPLMQELIKQAKLGKPIIGVCNGAQILIESGLVPGLQNEQIGGALAQNVRIKDNHVVGTGFYNTWCDHKVISKVNIFMSLFDDNEIFQMPIAHGEGRFVFPVQVLEAMKNNNQVLIKYCDDKGAIINNFPTNPNGTMDNIAAISNPSGNVIAMMPHPERSKISPKFFNAMRKYIESTRVTASIELPQKFIFKTIDLNLPRLDVEQYLCKGQQLIIESVITDKEAGTINQTLKELNIDAKVSQMSHWETNKDANIDAIIKSEELFNPNKENVISGLEGSGKGSSKFVLVSYNDDTFGESKKEILVWQGIMIEVLKKSILWKIDGDYQAVIDSNILANPFSQTILTY